MLTRLRNPLVALIVLIYLSAFLTSPATAAMVGALASDPSAAKAEPAEWGRIQKALETEIVKARLEAHGLTPGEVRERLQDLSDEQIHLMAQASDRVLAGGDGTGVVVAVLVIVLLVLLILYVQKKTIVIR
jgi:hypothetical protein